MAWTACLQALGLSAWVHNGADHGASLGQALCQGGDVIPDLVRLSPQAPKVHCAVLVVHSCLYQSKHTKVDPWLMRACILRDVFGLYHRSCSAFSKSVPPNLFDNNMKS